MDVNVLARCIQMNQNFQIFNYLYLVVTVSIHYIHIGIVMGNTISQKIRRYKKICTK